MPALNWCTGSTPTLRHHPRVSNRRAVSLMKHRRPQISPIRSRPSSHPRSCAIYTCITRWYSKWLLYDPTAPLLAQVRFLHMLEPWIATVKLSPSPLFSTHKHELPLSNMNYHYQTQSNLTAHQPRSWITTVKLRFSSVQPKAHFKMTYH